MITVDDPDDPRLAVFRRNERGLSSRPQRRDDGGDGLFIAEGDLVVDRALAVGCVPVAALVDATRPPASAARLDELVDVFAAGQALRTSATQLAVAHSIVAVFHRPARPSPAELATGARRLVLVEGVDNPANIGGIVRNAAGLGWDGLILDVPSADPLARRALRVSMGHALALPHARTTDMAGLVQLLRATGFQVCGLTPAADAIDLRDIAVAERTAILIGSERSGLSDRVASAATVRVRIPMAAGVDSLNAAAASAVACYALRPAS